MGYIRISECIGISVYIGISGYIQISGYIRIFVTHCYSSIAQHSSIPPQCHNSKDSRRAQQIISRGERWANLGWGLPTGGTVGRSTPLPSSATRRRYSSTIISPPTRSAPPRRSTRSSSPWWRRGWGWCGRWPTYSRELQTWSKVVKLKLKPSPSSLQYFLHCGGSDLWL